MVRESARRLASSGVSGSNEHVVAVAPVYGHRADFNIVTDRRLIKWEATVLNRLVDIATSSVTSSKLTGNDVYAYLNVHTGTDSIELGPSKRVDAQRLLDSLRADADASTHAGRARPSPATDHDMSSLVDLLSKLRDLHSADLLSVSEHEAKKAAILRRM
ncbi:hypothetical protein GCM10009629_51650 [Pseudonocardia alni]